MNRRIYYDGALINKIGIDRIVIKKVVLKEINAEKLDTALTCCAIHYDKVIVEGRQFYLTEKDNKFNYLKIDDNELGTLTFGVKNKQYGIYQFSPKEMWGGTNLVNYSAKEIHEFIEDAKIKLKDKYGLEVDFDDSEIREIELNTTFATKHKFSAYRRAITVMLFIMPYLKKDDVRSEKYRKTEEKLISSETVYNKQLSICVYNKTKEMELAMLKLAIQRHFETERQNFSGRQFKIKTLALFFIDDITSYRDSEDGKEAYLKVMFERLLLEKIEELLRTLPDSEQEYKDYLEASKADIPACHAGYFAQDNSDSDEATISYTSFLSLSLFI